MQIVSETCVLTLASIPEIIRSPIIEFIIAVLGISIGVVSLIWARRFRVNPRMVYQTHDFFVVGQPDASALGDIKILFNGSAVPRVIVTQLGVWNAGNITVRGSDIVAADPLAINFEDGSLILGSTRLKVTREVNAFQIKLSEQDRSRAFLEFDYLDAGDGATFQIIHTGGMNKAKVTGSLRGIPRGLENWGDLQEWSEQKGRFSSLMPQLIVVTILIGYGLSRSLVVARYPSAGRYFDWMLGGVVALFFLIIIFAIAFAAIYSFRARSHATPKALSRK